MFFGISFFTLVWVLNLRVRMDPCQQQSYACQTNFENPRSCCSQRPKSAKRKVSHARH